MTQHFRYLDLGRLSRALGSGDQALCRRLQEEADELATDEGRASP